MDRVFERVRPHDVERYILLSYRRHRLVDRMRTHLPLLSAICAIFPSWPSERPGAESGCCRHVFPARLYRQEAHIDRVAGYVDGAERAFVTVPDHRQDLPD